MSEPQFKQVGQDSYTEKCRHGTLKVYIDMSNLEDCNLKLKNFVKIKQFIEELNKV